METMLKVGAVAVLGALCAVVVKGTARQLALVLSIAAAIFLAAVVTMAFFVLVRRKKALEKTEGKDVGRDE